MIKLLLLDLFPSFDPSIYSPIDFPALGNLNGNASFNCTVLDYSCPYQNGFRDHVRDVPQEDIFILLLLLLEITFFVNTNQVNLAQLK